MNKMSNKKCKTETSVAKLIKPKKNYLYECHCICCGGKKVDPRTQEKHATERCFWKSDDDRKNQENAIMARKKKYTNLILDINPPKTISNKSKKRKRDDTDFSQPNKSDTLTDSFPDSFQLNNDKDMHTLFSSNFRTALDNNVDEENQYYIHLEEEEDDNRLYQEEMIMIRKKMTMMMI